MSTKIVYLDFHAPLNRDTANRLRDACLERVRTDDPERIYISFCCEGGSNSPAFHIYNFLRALPCALTMHNTGVVESSGLTVFLAADTRYACQTSRFLIHGPGWSYTNSHSNIAQMEEHLSILRHDEEIQKRVISERAGCPAADLDRLHTHGRSITPNEAQKYGIIQEIRPYVIPTGVTVHPIRP